MPVLTLLYGFDYAARLSMNWLNRELLPTDPVRG
jgi:hypothetical protein